MKKSIGITAAVIMIMTIITGCGKDYVKLGEYKGIEGEKVVCNVTDEEVSEAIDDMLYDYTTYDDVTDRAAENGDYVNIDYIITKIDGKPYEPDDDSEDSYSGYGEDIIIGEDYVYPEVDEALPGMNVGDKKTVTAELTDYFVDEDMVGKKAEIEVKLNSISVENIPEYNETFVKENLGYETTAEYEADLKQKLLAEKEEEYKYDTVSQIMDTVINNSTFKGYDKETYAACEEEYDSSNEQMAEMYGMELSEYEKLIGVDKSSKKEEVIAMVRERQVIDEIAKVEGISVSEDDVKEFVDGIYEEYEYENADAFIKDYGMDYLIYYLTSEKVYDFLYDNAKLTEITEEEYEKKLEEEGFYDDEEETDESDDEEIEVNLDGESDE